MNNKQKAALPRNYSFQPPPNLKKLPKRPHKLIILALLLVVIAAGIVVYISTRGSGTAKSTTVASQTKSSKSSVAVVKPAPKPSVCASNTITQNIVVSISQQHLWACTGSSQLYDAAVITGMQQYPADLTPVGIYHISSKLTGQTLAGADSTGSWSDYVNYWMPFLVNQYGTYGFHDLTEAANGSNGRADSDFGNIDINAPYTAAKHASHGCVELPLATAKWLYGWADVGATVTIQS